MRQVTAAWMHRWLIAVECRAQHGVWQQWYLPPSTRQEASAQLCLSPRAEPQMPYGGGSSGSGSDDGSSSSGFGSRRSHNWGAGSHMAGRATCTANMQGQHLRLSAASCMARTNQRNSTRHPPATWRPTPAPVHCCRPLWLLATSTAMWVWASSALRRWPPPSAVRGQGRGQGRVLVVASCCSLLRYLPAAFAAACSLLPSRPCWCPPDCCSVMILHAGRARRRSSSFCQTCECGF